MKDEEMTYTGPMIILTMGVLSWMFQALILKVGLKLFFDASMTFAFAVVFSLGMNISIIMFLCIMSLIFFNED